MKKTIAVFLACLLVLGALSGCGSRKAPEPPTAASLLKEAAEKQAAADSAAGTVQGKVALATKQSGIKMEIKMDLDLDFEAMRAPIAVHAGGNIGLSLLGMDADLPMELYALEEDGELAAYIKVMDSWMQQRTAKPAETQTANMDSILALTGAITDTAVLQEATEEIRGVQAYRIDGTITGEMLQPILAEAASSGELSSDALSLLDDLQLEATMWLDTETGLPLREEVRLASPWELKNEASFSALDLLIDFTGFGTVSGVTVPPEAKDAPQVDSVLESLF